MNRLIENRQNFYKASANVTVDEQCRFMQYMPNKTDANQILTRIRC